MIGCLDHLGKLQRAVVSLRMLDEVAGEDVAAMLGLPSSHVAVLLHWAKLNLRSCMGIALKLAEKGFRIAVHYYLNERAATDTLTEVRKRGSEGMVVQADVCRPDEISRMFGLVKAEFGMLAVFVSNARPEVPTFFQPPMDITLKQWDTAFDSAPEAASLQVTTTDIIADDTVRVSFLNTTANPINGAAQRVGRNDTPWTYRDAKWAQVIVGVDPDPANNEKIISWTREYFDALHPYSAGGAYVNFMMEEGEDRIRATYGDNYERLVKVKNKYDPTNLFRVNQNIKPTV